VTLEQMKLMTSALIKDPDRVGAVKEIIKGKVEEILPHRGR
jgi:hypothetical protein